MLARSPSLAPHSPKPQFCQTRTQTPTHTPSKRKTTTSTRVSNVMAIYSDDRSRSSPLLSNNKKILRSNDKSIAQFIVAAFVGHNCCVFFLFCTRIRPACIVRYFSNHTKYLFKKKRKKLSHVFWKSVDFYSIGGEFILFDKKV